MTNRNQAIQLLLTLSVFAIASIGCSPRTPESKIVSIGAADRAQRARSIEEFRFVNKDTTMADVIQSLGPPDKDMGSGIHILVYRLPDDSEVWIGTPDASAIWYVRHGTETIYERTASGT